MSLSSMSPLVMGHSHWADKFTVLTAGLLLFVTPVSGQNETKKGAQPAEKAREAIPKEKPSAPVAPVVVRPEARDGEIRDRIEKILQATGAYADAQVSVKEGVVFLKGTAATEQLKAWAGETAGKVQDVVAVFNGIGVVPPSPWDFSPAVSGLSDLWQSCILSLPFVMLGLAILACTWVFAHLSTRATRWLLAEKVASVLLGKVIARAIGVLIFLLGIYITLQIAGLARLALTVLGGTGLLGLAIGIAFREITENFLASIFLSVQNPFRTGDLVEITGTTGLVQRVTARATFVMTLDGTLVQIPNATVYKSTIRNFTINPSRREDFVIGIGYQDLVPKAQEVALGVLAKHPAVLKDPEPWVLVDSLGASSVQLRIYFWMDSKVHSWLKVKSSVMRLIKRAFQDAAITMPDESRELIFPEGVPVRLVDRPLDQPNESDRRGAPAPAAAPKMPEAASTSAEGGLRNEAEKIQELARQSQRADEGENVLNPDLATKQGESR